MTENAAFRPDPWARAWRTLASGRLLLTWLILLSLIGLVTLWFPQAPRSAYLQDGGLEGWLITVRPQLGRSADTLLALGFLGVARSTWLRLILAGTALTLLLRAYDAGQRLIRSSTLPAPACALEFKTAVDPPTALQVLLSHLPRDSRVRTEDDPDHRLTAQRPLASIGSIGTMIGCLLMLGGWLWTQAAGWAVSDIMVTEEIPATISPSGQTLALDDLALSWGESNGPMAVEARLVLEDGPASAAGEISLDRAWSWQGVTYNLGAVGPALQVSGTGSDGMDILLQTAANRPPQNDLTFMLPSDSGPRSFAAPDEGVVVQAEGVSHSEGLAVHLRIYRGHAGELVEDRSITDKISIDVGDSQLDFDVVPFAQVSASYSPGRWLLALGAGLAFACLLCTLAIRPLQLDARAVKNGDETQLTLAVGRSLDATWLRALADQLDFVSTGDDNGV